MGNSTEPRKNSTALKSERLNSSLKPPKRENWSRKMGKNRILPEKLPPKSKTPGPHNSSLIVGNLLPPKCSPPKKNELFPLKIENLSPPQKFRPPPSLAPDRNLRNVTANWVLGKI